MTSTSKTLLRLCVPGLAAVTMVAGSPLIGLGMSSASAQTPVTPTRAIPVDCPANSNTTTTRFTATAGGSRTAGECVTQARAGTNRLVSFRFEDANGVPASGRAVDFTLDGVVAPGGATTPTDATFSGQQPSQTQVLAGAVTATCTTDANGICSVSVFDPTPGNDRVTARDRAIAAVVTDETIQFRNNDVTAVRLNAGNSIVVSPDAFNFPTPGRPIQQDYTVADSTGAPVAGQALTITLNRAAFFTNNCTPTTAGQVNRNANGTLAAPDYRNCTFSPAPANGAPVGALASLGQTQTVTTDRNGQFTVTVAEGRDQAFDDNGLVQVTLSASGPGAPAFSTGSPNSSGPINFQSTAPLNGQSVNIVSIDTDVNPALVNTGTNNVQDRTLLANGGTTPGTRQFVLRLRDQFGNLTSTARGAGVPTGAAQDALRLTKTGVGRLQQTRGQNIGFVGTAGNPGTTDQQTANNLIGSFLTPVTQVGPGGANGLNTAPAQQPREEFTFDTRGLNSGQIEQGLASLIARYQAPTSTFVFAGTSTSPTSVDQTSTAAARTLTDTVNLDVFTPTPRVTLTQTPNDGNVAAGTVVTEQATVLDQRGQAIRNSFVNFLRSGTNNDCTNSANNGTGSQSGVQTNAQGQASFTFSCSTPSQQNITAVATDGSGNELARASRTVTFGTFATASATSTATTSPTATPTATATATSTPTSTPTTGTPTPTATVTAPAPVQCVNPVGIALNREFIIPGIPVTVTLTAPVGAEVQIQAYSRPSTEYRVVRQGVVANSNGTISFDIVPGTNTRLFANCVSQTRSASAQRVVNVRTALSLTVVRNGTRNYTFQGRILPRRADQLITLYRVTSNGTRVLTSQLKTDSSGTYRINRRFTGSGTFGFLTRTGQTLTNAAGESSSAARQQSAGYLESGRGDVRPTAIF